MNIELSYTEAIAVRSALDNAIRDSHELFLDDADFKKKYPKCHKSIEAECEKMIVVRNRIQAELDRL